MWKGLDQELTDEQKACASNDESSPIESMTVEDEKLQQLKEWYNWSVCSCHGNPNNK